MTNQCPNIPKSLEGIVEIDGMVDDNTKLKLIKNEHELSDPSYIRTPTLLYGTSPENKVTFIWLTVSQTNANFENLDVTGLIHVTGGAKFSAKDCTFQPSKQQDNVAIEVFAKSRCEFENCTFQCAKTAPLTVRDGSTYSINNCKFQLNEQASLLLFDNSSGNIIGSIFNGTKKFAIYLYNDSESKIENSHFKDAEGKGLFVFKNSKAIVDKCTFTNCKGGAINASTQGEAEITNCTFRLNGHSGIHAQAMTKTTIKGCEFDSVGIVYEYAPGNISECKFNSMKAPAICTLGKRATPIISDCLIDNCNNFGLVIRDASRPNIYNLTIRKGKTNGIMISDFAAPRIAKTTIDTFGLAAICCANGATPEIIGCHIKNCSPAVKIISDSNPIIRNTEMSGEIDVLNCGRLEEENFTGNYVEKGCCCRRLLCKEGKVIVDECECKKPEDPNAPDGVLPKLKLHNLDVTHEHCHHDDKTQNGQQKCIICNEAIADCACVPCGHVLYCEKCQEKYHKTCPLCATTVIKVKKLFKSSDTCSICMDRKTETVFLPCGHTNCCYVCASQIWKTMKTCPECRARIISFRHLFPTV